MNKKGAIGFIAAFIVVLSVIGIYRFSYAPSAIQVNGAVATARNNEFRAYSPYIEFMILREGYINRPIELLVNNVSSNDTLVDIKTTNEQDACSCQTEVLSPTQLKLIITGGRGLQKIILFPNDSRNSKGFRYAVLGDSQGRNENLAAIIKEINTVKPDFVIHLGDMTSSGTEKEYDSFLSTINKLECPFYTVIGNHDVKNKGRNRYIELFGPVQKSFSLRGYNFVFLDTSSMGSNSELFSQVKMAQASNLPYFVFMHVPPYDPRQNNHGFLDKEEADVFMANITSHPNQPRALFAGHIHMFSKQEFKGIPMVISGGGGAPLYAAPEDGGFHHFCLVTVNQDKVGIEPYAIEVPKRDANIVISSDRGDIEVTAEQLAELSIIKKKGSFENIHGNIVGEGMYKGIPVRELIENFTGGINKNQALLVQSIDGFSQVYAYENIYPEEVGWAEIQGEMVLAIEYNDAGINEWPEGYRIAFLPDDGIYDNDNCKVTSVPNQGWHVYPSAGARWIKNVVRLEVISWN